MKVSSVKISSMKIRQRNIQPNYQNTCPGIRMLSMMSALSILLANFQLFWSSATLGCIYIQHFSHHSFAILTLYLLILINIGFIGSNRYSKFLTELKGLLSFHAKFYQENSIVLIFMAVPKVCLLQFLLRSGKEFWSNTFENVIFTSSTYFSESEGIHF